MDPHIFLSQGDLLVERRHVLLLFLLCLYDWTQGSVALFSILGRPMDLFRLCVELV